MKIRDIRLPDDKTAALSFIMGSQRFEYAVEPNRRLDPQVADEYFTVLMERVATEKGRAFVAEEDGRAIGWGVFIVVRTPVFVVEPERNSGYIDELFVDEAARGRGVGQALIAACEDEARRLGLKQIMLGVLDGNTRARAIYAQAGFAPYALELRKYL
ncbi:MAG TPA: GNAT family N-acetyltransferase [Rhizomicrobium sp.]|nr:GNAT family N-acetyltransferase [Rhizomicrobium sp.]